MTLPPAIILTTDRLILRQLVPDDVDFLTELLGDPRVMRFYPQTYDRDGAVLWLNRSLERYAADGHGFWLTCDRQTLQPHGIVGVLKQQVEDREIIEVGYILHHRFWGRGFATEAARACRDWAFRNTAADTVYSLIRPINLPSQAVARRNGMQPEPDPVIFHDIEHHLFRIARAEWETLAKFEAKQGPSDFPPT
jgi:RimJ/RimL family protein N-acetyltransferase